MQGEVLLDGPAVDAPALTLTAPISFWGGVNPKTSEVADPRHPEYGRAIAGQALFVPATIGSSSAAAILLELVHAGKAPAAIVLHEPDAILLLGLIVAREMGHLTPIALRLDARFYPELRGQAVSIAADGTIGITTRDTKIDEGHEGR
jgi:predicted aconitase with swiveling domain